MYTFKGINSALVGMSQELLSQGKERVTRGYTCKEFPHPIAICIENPCDRFITVKSRKWNYILGYAESLWLALGINNLDDVTGAYVKNLYNFSDDGKYWRAGYGPRMRFFSPSRDQYKIDIDRMTAHHQSIDQYRFVIESFRKDPNTRQALVTIADPTKDCFNNDDYDTLLSTKDMPCSRTLHFQKSVDGKLDMIVHMRSNDILWGFSAVNVFNFTLMQEYFSHMLGLPIGKYYHLADNFHVYSNFYSQVEEIASEVPVDSPFQYEPPVRDLPLSMFDGTMNQLYYVHSTNSKDTPDPQPVMPSAMYDDWANAFRYYWACKRKTDTSQLRFTHPSLAQLTS